MGKFLSRKLVAALAGVVTVVLVQVGLPEEAAEKIVDAVLWIVTPYIAGQSVVDTVTAVKAKA